MRTCRTCQQLLSLGHFYVARTGWTYLDCKKCHATVACGRRRRDGTGKQKVLRVRQLKETPCTDCGVQYHTCVMQFDHVPERGPKLFALSEAHRSSITWDDILAEVEKCDVVCANCHAMREHRRTEQRRAARPSE